MKDFFKNKFEVIYEKLKVISSKELEIIANEIINVNNNGKKILIFGNGGSAAIASHVSIDLTKYSGIRCVNFNESSLLTCFSNDYGYGDWCKKTLEFYADDGDLVILISSSGMSENILNAGKFCKTNKIKFITLSGFKKDNPLSQLGDYNLWVDSENYNIVETIHQTWLLCITDFIAMKN